MNSRKVRILLIIFVILNIVAMIAIINLTNKKNYDNILSIKIQAANFKQQKTFNFPSYFVSC